MKYLVTLVQRGMSAASHAVCGKSQKSYGMATQSPQHGGVIFTMPLEEYSVNAHDLIGNQMAGQQWVPEFSLEMAPAANKVELCGIPAGCDRGENGRPAEAEYVCNTYLYCATHAPRTATPLRDNVRPIGTYRVSPVARVEAPDVLPVMKEAPSNGVVEKTGDLPVENMEPPSVGSEAVNEASGNPYGDRRQDPSNPAFQDPANRGVNPAPSVPPPVPSSGVQEAPTMAPVSPQQPVKAPAVPVMDMLAELVDRTVSKQMSGLESRLMSAISSPKKNGHRKPAKAATEPTSFQILQGEAKSYGIDIKGKSRVFLEASIAEKKSQPVTASPPA